jgi:hypothetical protein
MSRADPVRVGSFEGVKALAHPDARPGREHDDAPPAIGYDGRVPVALGLGSARSALPWRGCRDREPQDT